MGGLTPLAKNALHSPTMYYIMCLFSQKLHLPPELSDTASRAQEDILSGKPYTGGRVEQKLIGKTSVSKHNIDF